MSLVSLEPGECFAWFEEIARIPHGSRNEKRLGDFLMRFGAERGLARHRDQWGNVCLKKPATGGMEHAPGVILQGHMDMVCVQREGRAFDFANDALNLVVRGDLLTADGTTLGADNGMALACILALLDAGDIPHPPLEAVFTVEEETGMGGAANFDVSGLTGTYFLNMDAEEEGVFCVSCAGGRRSKVTLPLAMRPAGEIAGSGSAFYELAVSGLAGGHSGIDIARQRGNAIKLMGRVLRALAGKYPCHLAGLSGGTAMNVIPSECGATIYCGCDAAALRMELAALSGTFKRELRSADGENLLLTAQPADPARTVLTEQCFSKVLAALTLLPDGVASMDVSLPGRSMVESSSNLGVVAMEDGAMAFTSLTRSSVNSRKDFLDAQIRTVAECIGAGTAFSGDYPAWEFNPASELLAVCTGAYRELFGSEARVEGIHAGLECGLFLEKFHSLGKKVDCIAFGPTITGAHTVDEAVSIRSVANTWKLLLAVLRLLGNRTG